MKSQSRRWQRVATETSQALRALQLSGGTLWALGDGEIHRRRADGTWERPIRLPGEPWSDLIVAGHELAYGVTEGQPLILEWRAGVVTTVGGLARCISNDARLSVFGDTLAAGCPYYSGLAFWRRDAPRQFVETDLARPIALALIGDDDAVVLEMNGLLRLRRGAAAALALAPPKAHRLLWATRNNLVTASPDGEFAHAAWDAGDGTVGPWTTLRAPGVVSLRALWGLNADDLYAAGAGGVVLHFDGRAWRRVEVPATAALSCIAGAGGDVWIGGETGTLLRFSSV
jgi:hypothetical protein